MRICIYNIMKKTDPDTGPVWYKRARNMTWGLLCAFLYMSGGGAAGEKCLRGHMVSFSDNLCRFCGKNAVLHCELLQKWIGFLF